MDYTSNKMLSFQAVFAIMFNGCTGIMGMYVNNVLIMGTCMYVNNVLIMGMYVNNVLIMSMYVNNVLIMGMYVNNGYVC